MKKKILLVDDDHVFNFIHRKVIQNTGISAEIQSALNGKEALDLLTGYRPGSTAVPDVIFLDLNMPIMDGFDFLESFKRVNIPGKHKVSIIVVTSSVDPKDIERARSFGVDHYLIKPLKESDIRAALEI